MAVPRIDEEELRFRYSRSSGPGGQNVNRVETRVTLLFDVEGSPSLSAAHKRTLRRKLATRITKDGILQVVAQRHRTREANRRAAVERFQELVAEALRPRRRRRPTSVPAAAKRRRLESKKRRAELKRRRATPRRWDD